MNHVKFNGLRRQIFYMIKVVGDNRDFADDLYFSNKIDNEEYEYWRDALRNIKESLSEELNKIP